MNVSRLLYSASFESTKKKRKKRNCTGSCYLYTASFEKNFMLNNRKFLLERTLYDAEIILRKKEKNKSCDAVVYYFLQSEWYTQGSSIVVNGIKRNAY